MKVDLQNGNIFISTLVEITANLHGEEGRVLSEETVVPGSDVYKKCYSIHKLYFRVPPGNLEELATHFHF